MTDDIRAVLYNTANNKEEERDNPYYFFVNSFYTDSDAIDPVTGIILLNENNHIPGCMEKVEVGGIYTADYVHNNAGAFEYGYQNPAWIYGYFFAVDAISLIAAYGEYIFPLFGKHNNFKLAVIKTTKVAFSTSNYRDPMPWNLVNSAGLRSDIQFCGITTGFKVEKIYDDGNQILKEFFDECVARRYKKDVMLFNAMALTSKLYMETEFFFAYKSGMTPKIRNYTIAKRQEYFSNIDSKEYNEARFWKKVLECKGYYYRMYDNKPQSLGKLSFTKLREYTGELKDYDLEDIYLDDITLANALIIMNYDSADIKAVINKLPELLNEDDIISDDQMDKVHYRTGSIYYPHAIFRTQGNLTIDIVDTFFHIAENEHCPSAYIVSAATDLLANQHWHVRDKFDKMFNKAARIIAGAVTDCFGESRSYFPRHTTRLYYGGNTLTRSFFNAIYDNIRWLSEDTILKLARNFKNKKVCKTFMSGLADRCYIPNRTWMEYGTYMSYRELSMNGPCLAALMADYDEENKTFHQIDLQCAYAKMSSSKIPKGIDLFADAISGDGTEYESPAVELINQSTKACGQIPALGNNPNLPEEFIYLIINYCNTNSYNPLLNFCPNLNARFLAHVLKYDLERGFDLPDKHNAINRDMIRSALLGYNDRDFQKVTMIELELLSKNNDFNPAIFNHAIVMLDDLMDTMADQGILDTSGALLNDKVIDAMYRGLIGTPDDKSTVTRGEPILEIVSIPNTMKEIEYIKEIFKYDVTYVDPHVYEIFRHVFTIISRQPNGVVNIVFPDFGYNEKILDCLVQ